MGIEAFELISCWFMYFQMEGVLISFIPEGYEPNYMILLAMSQVSIPPDPITPQGTYFLKCLRDGLGSMAGGRAITFPFMLFSWIRMAQVVALFAQL